MEIIRLKSDLVSINISETEKELLRELTHDLLRKLGNENPQTLVPRLFPEAILDEPELNSKYKAMTLNQLENSHRKAAEALKLLTSGNEISLEDFILVTKGLNIIRLQLSEALGINDELQNPLTPGDNQNRAWVIFQYLGQMLFQCIEELDRDF